jgi:polyisoprenoid-binding protein YceI
MKRLTRVAGALALVLSTSWPLLAETETFTFDRNHSLVGFRIRHFVTKVEGRFRDYTGTIVLDRQNPSVSKVDLVIQAASIDTGNENRDKDLRSPNFFDVEKYPTLTFKSTRVEPRGKDAYLVTGDFTMHGVTRPLSVTVKHGGFIKAGKMEKAGFEASFPIDRKDYGITWNRAVDQGGFMLGDDVEINLQVEANKQAPEEAKPAAPAAAAAPAAKN